MGGTIGIIVPNSNDKRAAVLGKFLNMRFPTSRIVTLNFRNLIGDFWVRKKNTKASYRTTEQGGERFWKAVDRMAGKYEAFVCIDEATASYLVPDAGAMHNTDKLTGMIMQLGTAPCLIHFDPLHLYGRMYEDEHHAAYAHMSGFYVKKLWNRVQGIEGLEKPVHYMIPQSVRDLKACEKIAAQSDLIAFDIENSGGYTSCIGFACAGPWPVRPVFVIPYMTNLSDGDGTFWSCDSTFELALNTTARILANDVPKAAHNGGYDITHLFRMGMPVNNYVFDTMLMMHSAWPTVPRSLYIGASMFLSNYRYWKDDAKDVGEDGKVKWQVPKTPEKTWAYWHYNGLDCANTLELCLAILRMWMGTKEARKVLPDYTPGFEDVWLTYVREFAIEFGPCLYMSMSGLRADPTRQYLMKQKLEREAEEADEYLKTLIDDPNFNANSPQQNAELIYDVLDIKPLARKGRTTDKRILQKFADLHPIYRDVIEAVWAVKEPRNNASKYCENPYWKSKRMLYQLKGAATTTRRLASSKHNFGMGTNFQNVPKPMRVLYEADHGEILVASDYSQSDSYFVAFESQDPAMMETVTDDRDTHSVHVEFFFGHSYDSVVVGAKAKEAWVVDPVSGVRQIIKKVSHGTNYDMGGDTMLLNIRREAAIAMVNALLNSPNAKHFIRFMGLDTEKGVAFYSGKGALWSDKQLARACEFAQGLYYARYPVLSKWKKASVAQALADRGVIKMFGGSTTTMLGKPINNPRFVPAAYGQGGTSGNINNAMLRLFYCNGSMWARGFRMVIQVHDELICAVPPDALELVAEKVEIMETPCTIHGRTFTIPVEAELSLSWDAKNTVVWQGLDDERTTEWYLNAISEMETKTRKGLGLE